VLSKFRLSAKAGPPFSGQATAGGFVINCLVFGILSFDIHLTFACRAEAFPP
jgi:hypothetical protein